MPRRNRCVLPELPCNITQRGVDRRAVFSTDQDRTTYLRLVQENLGDAGVRILGYCLMTNHVHLIAVPERENSLSILFRGSTDDTRNTKTRMPAAPAIYGKIASSAACSDSLICGRLCATSNATRCGREWWSMQPSIHGRAPWRILGARTAAGSSIWTSGDGKGQRTGRKCSKARTSNKKLTYGAALMQASRLGKRAS